MPGVRALCGGVALALFVSSTPAHADVKACIAASEAGQHARAAGKLREAQAQFHSCADTSCPSIVRRDCQQWKTEITQTMPSVVFAARDRAGKDLFDVAVSMDGETLVTKLDGNPVSVDPGKHVFRFEVAGPTPIVATETVLVRENERKRNVTATFDAPDAAKAPEPAAAPVPVSSSSSSSSPSFSTAPSHREHSTLPWVVAGVGAAGLVTGILLVATASRPDNCSADTRICVPRDGQTQAELEADQSDAQAADNRRTLGLVVGGIGLGALAGGLVWHFLEPTGPRPGSRATGLRFTPWSAGRSSGVALGGVF